MFACQPPIHPSREYNRFIPTKKAFTGMDPSGSTFEFIKKDIIRPLTRKNLYDIFDNDKNNPLYKTQGVSGTKWALKTNKRAPNFDTLPKFQQYKTYYFPPKFNNKDVDKYRAFSLKTDHIGIKVPNIKKINDKESYLKMKEEFSIQLESKREHKWAPSISSNNIITNSSKDYNIINFKNIKNSKIGDLMNKTLYHRKKGIGEYSDLTKTFSTNFNKNYERLLTENPYRFRKYTGIFSEMYDAAHRNGNIIEPFEHKSNK